MGHQIINDAEHREPLRLYENLHLHMLEETVVMVSAYTQHITHSLRFHDLNRVGRGEQGQFCERHQPFQRGDDGLGVLELATVEGDESTDFAWRRAIRGGIYLSSARIAHPTVG